MLYGTINGENSSDKVQEYLDEGGPPEVELARELYPYGNAFLLSNGVLKLILLLVSFRKPKVCKSFFYVMTLHMVIRYAFLPLDFQGTMNDHWYSLALEIAVLSFDLFPSLVLTQIIVTSFYVSRSVYFDEKIDVPNLVQISLIAFSTICGIQGMFNKIGFIVIETELLREGND